VTEINLHQASLNVALQKHQQIHFNEVYFGLLGEETTNRIVSIYSINAQRDKARPIDYITLWQTFCNNILQMMK